MAKPLFIYNRFENATDTTNGVIIPSGGSVNITGTPTYAACKFNNGIYSNSTANYVKIAMTGFNANLFSWGTWFKTDWACTNGNAQDGASHSLFHWRGDSSNFVNTVFKPATEGMKISMRILGIFYEAFNTNAALTWNAGTIHHIGQTYSQSANEVKTYLDGVFVNTTSPSAPTVALTGGEFYILATQHAGGVAWEFDGVIDNFKVYNGLVKPDFKDYDSERSGLNDLIM